MCVHVRAVARLQLEVIEGVVPEKGGWTGWTEPCPRNGSGVAVCRAGFSGDCWLFGRDLYTALVYNASTLFGPFFVSHFHEHRLSIVPCLVRGGRLLDIGC